MLPYLYWACGRIWNPNVIKLRKTNCWQENGTDARKKPSPWGKEGSRKLAQWEEGECA